jgi:hypothetical protein
MSTVTGGQGNIVTNGLVLNLDAANPRSYPQPYNGVIWNDISGNSRNGTLTNGPTFNSGNGGSVVFDGTNDYAAFPAGTFGYSPGTTGDVSLEMWIYPTGPYTAYVAEPPTTNLGGFFGQGYFGTTTGWGIGVVVRSSINYWAWQVRNAGTVVQPALTVSFTNNSWYHVVGTFIRNDFSRLYINGTLHSSASSAPLNGISITPNISFAAIGNGGQANNFFSGCRIATARIYSKGLSQQEVLQNFNATRARFGI